MSVTILQYHYLLQQHDHYYTRPKNENSVVYSGFGICNKDCYALRNKIYKFNHKEYPRMKVTSNLEKISN